MDKLRDRVWISVIGGSAPPHSALEEAYELGRLIAERGAVLVCGGLGGVMEAACRGAKDAGGITVGILPTDRREDANPYVDIAIPTGLGIARNLLVVRAGDVAIAVDGAWGTLSEIALAKNIGKTVIGLHSFNIDGIIPAQTPQEAVEKAFQHIQKAGGR